MNDLKDLDVAGDGYQYLLGANYNYGESILIVFRYEEITFWATLGANEKREKKIFWAHQPLPLGEQERMKEIITNHLRPELERYVEENRLKILIKLDSVI